MPATRRFGGWGRRVVYEIESSAHLVGGFAFPWESEKTPERSLSATCVCWARSGRLGRDFSAPQLPRMLLYRRNCWLRLSGRSAGRLRFGREALGLCLFRSGTTGKADLEPAV